MKRILTVFSFFLIGSCASAYAHSVERKSEISALEAAGYLKKGYVLYEGKNQTLHELIFIKKKGEARVAFHLFVENQLNGKTASLHGIAKMNIHVDLESDEDANGTGYFAGEYVYGKGCELHIRLELPERNHVRTIEVDCDRYHDASCPFDSVQLLERVVKPSP